MKQSKVKKVEETESGFIPVLYPMRYDEASNCCDSDPCGEQCHQLLEVQLDYKRQSIKRICLLNGYQFKPNPPFYRTDTYIGYKVLNEDNG